MNRRLSPRIRYSQSVTVTPSASSDIHLKGLTLDISESAIRVVVSANLLVGNTVVIAIQLPTFEGELSLLGEVKWAQPSIRYQGRFDTGIQFLFLSDEHRSVLKDFIQKLPYLSAKKTSESEEKVVFDSAQFSMSVQEARLRTFLWAGLLVVVVVIFLIFYFVIMHSVDSIDPGI
ncbi:MAG: PilZ domain-containing protein [Candidatus Omnitrophica bacterium]|nr:PilZ domain-containing protein [Candidatus Omnitrophota bacterium]